MHAMGAISSKFEAKDIAKLALGHALGESYLSRKKDALKSLVAAWELVVFCAAAAVRRCVCVGGGGEGE